MRNLLLAGLSVALATGVTAAPPMTIDRGARDETPAAADASPYVVRLETRSFVPRSRADAAGFRGEKVFLQFERTLTVEEQASLEQAGVVFHESLGPFTYLVALPGSASAAVQRSPLFLGAEPIQPTDKVTETLFKGEIPQHARRPEGAVAVFFRFYENVTLDEAVSALEVVGISVSEPGNFLFGNRLEGVATPDRILAACAGPAVRAAFEIPAPPAVSNAQAAGISNVPPVYAAPYGLSGSGVKVGIWDEGPVRTTHVDLTGRVTLGETDGPLGMHSTHVTGTVIGSGAGNAAAKGMAPAATAVSYDFNDDVPTEQANASRLAPLGKGIALSNNSWAPVLGWTHISDFPCWVDNGDAGFGAYNGTTQTWDDLVRRNGLTVVKSAGNEGSQCGPADCTSPRNTDCDGVLGSDGFYYDNIDYIGTAKNMITVGALEDDGITKVYFSSCGPTDDGRIKPDVVANGVELTSAGWESDTQYLSSSGTSMSGPVVAGVTALLDEQWMLLHPARSSALNKPSPELLKALLINTATDLGRPGPDYAYGHGLVKAKEAVDQMKAGNVRSAFVSEGETLNFRLLTPAGTPTGPIKTTLAWSDLPGASATTGRYCNFVNFKVPCTSNAECTVLNPAAVCDAAPCGAVPCHLKNDLDGFLWNAAGNAITGLPFVPPGVGAFTNNAYQYINRVDNVEVVQASDPNGGDLRLTVFGFTVSGGQQRFTLAANKPLVLLPGNDNFASAKTLPALVPADPTATDCPSGQNPCPATLYPHNTWHSVNSDATLEPGEPSSAPTPTQAHSVWFTWVAPSTNTAWFDTAGADFDTTIQVWTGNSLGALTHVAFNDDFYGRQSRVAFSAVAGTTYRIQVRGVSVPAPAQDVSMGVFPLSYYLTSPSCGNGVVEGGEACDGGLCCNATCQLKFCSDGNACTSDSCNPASGCVFTNNTLACNDGDACTTGDTCGGGTCHGGPPPAVPGSTPNLTSTSKAHLSWPALSGATGYDVVRGNLVALRSSGGNFAWATETCLADNQAPTGLDDFPTPALGTGFFFLVRGTTCSGSGTYDTTSPKQVGSRDAEVNAAPITCSAACSRGRCTGGPPLAPSCDPCVAGICAVDPYCCATGWDDTCVEEVRSVCNSLTCPESAGACAHVACTLGGPLAYGCDEPPVSPSCVATVCGVDPYCCNTEWDVVCVNEVTHCGKNCN